jgi:predicted DNA-binding transcriptional regulator AlpA
MEIMLSRITEHYMEDQLLTEDKASEFCQLSLSYFRNLRRTGRGPTYVRPSPKVTMYYRSDLEAWKASWKTVGQTIYTENKAEDFDNEH